MINQSNPPIPGSGLLVCAHESDVETLEKESLRPTAVGFGFLPEEGAITRPIESMTWGPEAAEDEEEEDEEEDII
jgi:hypothetical protein